MTYKVACIHGAGVVRNQIMRLMSEARAAYIHVPFCRHRCGYCNFTLVAKRDALIDSYLEAIERELSWLETPREVDTLFFGGGTPTHLSNEQLRRLFQAIRRWFPLAGSPKQYEFSVEANPADIDEAKADLLAEFGVTRVSLGVQSFDDAKLELLERDHRACDIENALQLMSERVHSTSLDLIFATPGESQENWLADLQAALELNPDHVSTYGLTFERGTAFGSRLSKGELAQLDEDAERHMYEAAIDSLTTAGFEHYEVSNFAKSGHRCRHNETYWRGASYYAAGPGAARFIDGRRETNHRSTTTYLKRVHAGQSPVAESETLTADAAAREQLVFGLRMLAGVELVSFQQQTGYSVSDLAGDTIDEFVEMQLLEKTETHLRLTRKGLMVSDSIWPYLL